MFLFNNLKNRMLADFYIHRLSNDMKIAVQKNNLWGQIWYRSFDPVKKRRHFYFWSTMSLPLVLQANRTNELNREILNWS